MIGELFEVGRHRYRVRLDLQCKLTIHIGTDHLEDEETIFKYW